jgi:hypothetical protein
VYSNDSEILFPIRVAPELRDLRGETWRKLVDRVIGTPEASLDKLAFSLVLIRLCSCLTCHTDSYRAMRGCTSCARQSIRRFRGDDDELIALFAQARQEVSDYMKTTSEPHARHNEKVNSSIVEEN